MERRTSQTAERSGRPKVTSPQLDRRIIREVNHDPFITTNEIAINIGEPRLSSRTIRRRLEDIGQFKSRRAARKPWLREENRLKRLQWALAHAD